MSNIAPEKYKNKIKLKPTKYKTALNSLTLSGERRMASNQEPTSQNLDNELPFDVQNRNIGLTKKSQRGGKRVLTFPRFFQAPGDFVPNVAIVAKGHQQRSNGKRSKD